MTAGVDEPELVVFEALVVQLERFGDRRAELLEDGRPRIVECGRATQPVDRPKAPRRDEPGARVPRLTLGWPALDRRGARVVQRLLREIAITEEANERREHAL